MELGEQTDLELAIVAVDSKLWELEITDMDQLAWAKWNELCARRLALFLLLTRYVPRGMAD